jgi:membrane-bound inhibitor of C-type lysozyme
MKKLIITILLIIVAFGAWQFARRAKSPTPIATATYRCDAGKFITAAYYKGVDTPVAQGEMPKPGGYVEVSIDGGATTTLRQTISADGARYASADESLVFWNKGDTALIMRGNSMDLTYTNCTARQ